MTDTVLDKMPAFLARFRGDLRARYRRGLVPYYDLPATVEATRARWAERAKSVPGRIMAVERVALQLFLGRKLHAAMPRKEE